MELVLFFAAGLMIYAGQLKSFAKGYKIRFLNLRFLFKRSLSDGMGRLHFIAAIEVSNVTEFTGSLIKGNLFFNVKGQKVANVVISEKITIPKKDKIRLEIPFSIVSKNLFHTVSQAWAAVSENREIEIRLKGSLTFLSGTLDLNETINTKLIA